MHKKLKAALLCVFAVLCCLSTGCQLPGKTDEQIPEETTTTAVKITPSAIPEGFSIKIPSGFTETSSPYYETFYSKDDATIIITGEPVAVEGTLLKDYVEAIQRNHRQLVDGYTPIAEESLNPNGTEGRWFEFTYDIVGEDIVKKMHCLTGVFLQDDYAYVVTCKSYDTTYMMYEASFQKALQSVRIEQKAAPEHTEAPSAPKATDTEAIG